MFINKDFFEYENYKELLVIREFEELKKERKKDWNKVMWFLYFVFDYNSYYAEHAETDRITMFSKEIMENEDWYKNNLNWLEKYVKAYKKTQETSSLRFLQTVIDTMEKRRVFLENVEYTEDNIKNIDDAILKTASIMDMENKIKEALRKQGITRVKGNQGISLLEAGKLGV